MRTIINLAEDSLIAARNIARRERLFLGDAVSERIRRGSTVGTQGMKQELQPAPRGRAALVLALTALADDLPLARRHRDHDLSGEWAGYRDCHVKPDLVLIYRKPDADILRLARLGSHSELFG